MMRSPSYRIVDEETAIEWIPFFDKHLYPELLYSRCKNACFHIVSSNNTITSALLDVNALDMSTTDKTV